MYFNRGTRNLIKQIKSRISLSNKISDLGGLFKILEWVNNNEQKIQKYLK